MSEEQTTDGAVDNSDSTLLTEEPTNDEQPNDDGSTDAGNEDDKEVTYQLDDDGNQILDDDGNPIPEESSPPDAYDPFNMPEGMEVDEEMLGLASGTLKELGLNQEQAQKVVDLYAGKVKEDMDSFGDTVEAWRKSAREDSEYGGEALNANILLANRALKEFGNDEVKNLLEDTKLGNHPDVIRLLVNVGKTLKEDTPSGNSPSKQKLSRVDILYPES